MRSIMRKRQLTEALQRMDNIHFSEKQGKGDVIGYIVDGGREIVVRYKRVVIGAYLSLEHEVDKGEKLADFASYMKRWSVNGRFEEGDDTIVLYSVVPILDESFLPQQISHALLEIWDMTNIAMHCLHENQSLYSKYIMQKHPVYRYKDIIDYFIYLKNDEKQTDFPEELKKKLRDAIHMVGRYLNDSRLTDREKYILGLAIEEGEQILGK